MTNQVVLAIAFFFVGIGIHQCSHAGEEMDIANITFEKPAMKRITPTWLAHVKQTRKPQLDKLRALETKHQFPAGTFRIKWIIESMAGELNVKNKHDYEGHFQYGEYEWKRYCSGTPYDFDDAANCLPKFLNSYYEKAVSYMIDRPKRENMTPTDWYHYHNQGYRGAGEQRNAVFSGRALSRTVKTNMRSNIPTVYKSVFTRPFSDKEFSQLYYKMWDTEVFRIWNAIKDDDE